MDTRDWVRAQRLANKLEDEPVETRPRKTVNAATAAFLESVTGEVATRRKYSRIANHLDAFAAAHSLAYIDEFDLETLDAYRRERLRVLGSLSWGKELQSVRQMFRYWMDREWCASNPAAKLRVPAWEEVDRQPYTEEEVGAILAACDAFGRSSYERRRAKAMVMLLWRYGL